MKTSDFYYELPEELIAQTPLEQRDSSRLMLLDKVTGQIGHSVFSRLPEYLQPGDCLVMNDSRVLPARLIGRRATGGAVEVLLLTDLGGNVWECLTRPGRKTPVGTKIYFGEGELSGEVVEAVSDGNKRIRFSYEGIFLEVLEKLGLNSIRTSFTSSDSNHFCYIRNENLSVSNFTSVCTFNNNI